MKRIEGLAWVLVAVALLGVVAPAFVQSDNVHSDLETVAYDRIALSLRTFWADQASPDGPSLPTSFRVDPNFPLGTAALFALPYGLGLDPVFGSRLLTLFSALLAALGLGLLVAAGAGRTAGVLAAAAVWGLPAFTRNAVVTGEAAPYTAALLGSAALLAWECKQPRARTARLILAGALLGGTVLFRLDAFALAPVWIVAVAVSLGISSAGWVAAACLPLFAGHALVSWHIYGSATAFARRAAQVTKQNAAFHDQPLLRLLQALADQLTLPGCMLALAAAVFALMAVVRTGLKHRSPLSFFWLVLLGSAGAYLAMIGTGAMQPRLHRYLVPLLVLFLAAALMFAWGAIGTSLRRFIVVALVAGFLCVGGREALRDARDLRLPSAVPELAAWIATEHSLSMVRVSGYHPEMVVLTGLSETVIQPLPRSSRGALDVEALLEQRKKPNDLVLVAFAEDPLSADLADAAGRLALQVLRSDQHVVVYR